MGLDIEMKDSGTTSAADQPATPPPVPHITQMGKAKNGATVEADESSPKDEDAEDESSQGQGLLLDLYETLQTELREVRLHLLKLEMESNLREIKLFEEVSALEKLVEEQGLQIYQLEQQNNTLAGMIVDVTQEPGGSSAEVYSDATFEPELLIEPQSDVRGTELVSENTVFGSENILMEVMDSKSQSFQLESFSSEDVVEGRSPNSCDVRSCCEDVTEGKYGDVGVVCNTLLEPVMTKKKEVRLESSPFVEMLGTDNRDVGSESECTGEVLDFMSEEVGDSYLFLSEMRDLENRVVGDVDSTSVGPIVDNKVPGIRSNSSGETAGTTGRGFGWSSTEVVSPKMEASVKVVWTINSSIRPERDVIEFVDEVLNKHEEDICSSNTEGLEEFHGDKENIADPVETDVIADKLNVNYHPAEAERLEKDSQGSETVTETAVVTEKPNLDFHPMTVERLEKERGPHKIKLTLLCSKNLDPRDLKTLVALIEKGVATKEMRLMVRVMRHTMAIRRQITAATLISFLQQSLPAGSEPLSRLVPYLTKEEEKDMDVDASSPAGQSQPPAKQALLPEVEIYTYLLTLIFLIDQKQYEAAKTLSGLAIKRVQNFNRRTLDVLAARLYFYYSYSFELAGCLSQIRSSLLALHRTATLRHDELGQETLLNLLLRNYLHYNLYDQAEKLRSKTQRVESHSNQQLCRYLFYLGRIRTIQLEYTDSKECLLQAARKAPSTARGFRIQCNKWAVIVRLLLGEIPERTTFMQQGMQKALRPYFELTNAVRIGDLELFRSVAERNSATFHADKTQNLIVRLRHNVIRTGLRNISISYSRISLADVAAKLHFQSATAVADAESIVTKAIRDGGIDATVDHTNGWMQSKETGDIYSSQEPQTAFHSRIAFCLNTHNEAVKALRFPPDAHKKELESAEKRRERQQQEQELAKHIAEEDDDEF